MPKELTAPPVPVDEAHYGELARDLSAAYIAHRLRIKPATARKNHVDQNGKGVGEFWLHTARAIDQYMMNHLADTLAPAEARPLSKSTH